MDKLTTQDAQLMQASGATMSTDDDQSTMTGTTPTTNGSSSQGTTTNRPSWQGLQIHKSGTIYTTAMHKPTSTCTIGSSLIHVHQSISFVINPICTMCVELWVISVLEIGHMFPLIAVDINELLYLYGSKRAVYRHCYS